MLAEIMTNAFLLLYPGWSRGVSTQHPSLLLPREHTAGLSLGPFLLFGHVLSPTHQKQPPLRTLQYGYTWGPIEVLGGGLFLMSEVPLWGTIW